MKFTTGLVRLSYAHLFKPYSQAGNDPKYSAALLFPKSDKRTIDRLHKALEDIKKDDYSKTKWAGKGGVIGKIDSPVHDGDVEKEGDPTYKGMYYLNAKANPDRPPKIVDKDRNDIVDQSEVYSGCWVQAVLTFFSYNANGHKGIGVGLAAIRKIKDGPSLAGGTTVTDADFSDDLIDPNDISDDDLLG